MESGSSFHGYHHKLPTLSSSSSSEMNNDLKRKKTTRNGGGDEEECKVREQDRFMPVANVIRIMRRIVPAHGKISDDAKETMQECVSEFIGFVTGEANDRCQLEQRKTITAEDVLFAMSKLGFDSYVDPLSLFLHRYRHLESRPPTYDYHLPPPPPALPAYYAHPPPAFDSPYHHNG